MKSTFNLCSELRCHEEPSIPVPRVGTESRRFARRMAEATPTHNRSPNQTILNVGLRGMSAWTFEFRSFTNYKEMQGLLVLVDKKNWPFQDVEFRVFVDLTEYRWVRFTEGRSMWRAMSSYKLICLRSWNKFRRYSVNHDDVIQAKVLEDDIPSETCRLLHTVSSFSPSVTHNHWEKR
jgi:hypothetical protein